MKRVMLTMLAVAMALTMLMGLSGCLDFDSHDRGTSSHHHDR